ncbi:MAG: NifU family protein [Coriobacteriales bacterium]|jgi:Fe-S cluster biogenesis protein NfuA
MIDRGMLDYVMSRIRPQIQADGGDVDVTEVDDEKGIVYVALRGACVDCPLSALTLSQGIERVLTEHVPGVERVLPDMNKTVIQDPDTGDEASLMNSVHVTRVDEDGNIIEESTTPLSSQQNA